MSRSRIGQSGRYADIESMKSCPEANVVTVVPHAVSSLWRDLRMDSSSSTMATLEYPLTVRPHQPCTARTRCSGFPFVHGRAASHGVEADPRRSQSVGSIRQAVLLRP